MDFFDHGKITGNVINLHVSVLCLVFGLSKTMQFSFQVLPHNFLEKFGLENLDQILGQDKIYIYSTKTALSQSSIMLPTNLSDNCLKAPGFGVMG